MSRRLTHVAVRRDPNTATWWWVCIEPKCPMETTVQLRIDDHRAAVLSASEHVASAKLRTPSVTTASGRGAAGGER